MLNICKVHQVFQSDPTIPVPVESHEARLKAHLVHCPIVRPHVAQDSLHVGPKHTAVNEASSFSVNLVINAQRNRQTLGIAECRRCYLLIDIWFVLTVS